MHLTNPFIKNCRTGIHEDLFNRSWHYKKILSSKSLLDNKLQHKFYSTNRRAHTRYDETQSVNQKLVKSITNIENNYTNYLYNEDGLRKIKMPSRKDYMSRQRDKRISLGNLELCRRISQADSQLSSNRFKEFNLNKSKYAKLIMHRKEGMIKIDNQFFCTYKHLLSKQQMSSSYESTLRDQVGKRQMLPANHKKHRNSRKLRHKRIQSQKQSSTEHVAV